MTPDISPPTQACLLVGPGAGVFANLECQRLLLLRRLHWPQHLEGVLQVRVADLKGGESGHQEIRLQAAEPLNRGGIVRRIATVPVHIQNPDGWKPSTLT